jgi:hypothetical protein
MEMNTVNDIVAVLQGKRTDLKYVANPEVFS